MNKIVAALYSIASFMKPSCLWTVMEVLIPIIPAIITLCLSVRMDKQNRQLQKQIHNRDVRNQTRESVFSIYQAFLDAAIVLQQAGDDIRFVFIRSDAFWKWGLDIENVIKTITFANNKAKLLFPDDKRLTDYTSKCWNAFSDVYKVVNLYVHSTNPLQAIESAWDNMEQEYGISRGNYVAVIQKQEWLEEFERLCSNKHTENIQEKVDAYKELIRSDEFDDCFRPHLQIQELL